ncbi:hypothetical protein [Alicyclobacillus fodiniaquatilis]|uniref:Uncharacterized protein n=1 Tax=Alicyclobacillus fodiniaquatilis TaxID=1661150 RepID=A0ABW4JK27_9BACL
MDREIAKLPAMLREKVEELLSDQGTKVLAVEAEGEYPRAYLQWGYVLTILRYFGDPVSPKVRREILSIADVEVILQHCDWFETKKTLAATRVPSQNEFESSVTHSAS